jgi:patatin-related protein
MKEKELRLALVCYGGVSLAVYMHGVTKEVWKLLRASKALHNLRDPTKRFASRFKEVNPYADAVDTEHIYFELLREIGSAVSLRVIVDIIAGASAGGINGIMLARAIAEDLSLDPLRDLWLVNGDVERLLDEDAVSTKWSKLYMRPLVWAWGRYQASKVQSTLGPDVTQEVRDKLSIFVRSRWFQPPFSGVGFAKMLHGGLTSMGPEGAGLSTRSLRHRHRLLRTSPANQAELAARSHRA